MPACLDRWVRRAPWLSQPSRLPRSLAIPVILMLMAPWAVPASAETPGPGPSGSTGVRYRGRILAVGDSVMLGAQRCLEKLGYQVDAQGNRRMSAGIDLLQSGQLPARVVVHLGTNGGLQPRDLDRLMTTLGSDRAVFLVTIQLPDDTTRYTFEERTNAAIVRLPHRYPNAYVINWNRLSDQVDGLVGGDHIHLTVKGCTEYAALVDRLARSDIGSPARPGGVPSP